jgi:hypothetical protein
LLDIAPLDQVSQAGFFMLDALANGHFRGFLLGSLDSRPMNALRSFVQVRVPCSIHLKDVSGRNNPRVRKGPERKRGSNRCGGYSRPGPVSRTPDLDSTAGCKGAQPESWTPTRWLRLPCSSRSLSNLAFRLN